MKKTLTFLLALMMCLTLVACGEKTPTGGNDNDGAVVDGYQENIQPVVPQATPISGSCGEGVNYDLSADGVLTISGNGYMTDYKDTYDDGEVGTPWFGQRKAITKIVVEDGITGLSSYAFYKCTNLCEVTLPEGISTLKTCAFSGCEKLISVVLPKSITKLDSNAFEGCISLKSVEMPPQLDEKGLKEGVFWNCKALESIVIPEGVCDVWYRTFNTCVSLKKVVMPSTVDEIWADAFSYCSGLEEVIVNEGCERIGENSFSKCKKLTKIVIPASVKSIHNLAFEESENVTIYAPEGSYVQKFAEQNNIKFSAIQ